MSTLSQFTGGWIKSIQRGAISITTGGGSTPTTNTATITAVDPAKSVISLLGSHPGSNANNAGDARVELTNSTTVTASVLSYGTVTTATVAYQVVEHY